MKRSSKAILAAGLIAGAAAMTGCTANTTPVTTPTPQTAQQETPAPATAQPQTEQTTTPESGAEEAPGPIRIRVGEEEADAHAIEENGMLLLPLVETAQALGWEAKAEETPEETQTRRTITLQREDSRITVAWVSSDNTARQITWQRDGLLIPVDTKITTLEDVVYVPAAFFEEAMQAGVNRGKDEVTLTTPTPKDTPEKTEQTQ